MLEVASQLIVALSKPIEVVDKLTGVVGSTIVTSTALDVAVHPLTFVIVNVYEPLASAE